jgi:[protein-PII] uridylyltransferase
MWSAEVIDPALFDKQAFSKSLDTSKTPLRVFKDTLKKGHQILNESFEAGKSVKELVPKRAWLVDQLLIRAWRYNIKSEKISLVAVGGFGRGELHPCSDIDLMIIIPPRLNKESSQEIEKFLVFLWDIGLEVGHSVRTVKDCIHEAKNDITIATNIMESRLIQGDKNLYEKMLDSTGPNKIWRTKIFFEAKWEEQIQRHIKFNNASYSLEPNIKEGPGGLRDIQMVGWVAKRHFGANRLHDLVKHKFLTKEEFQILDKGQTFLWQIRFGLHFLTDRREDRLLFDHQRVLAKLFGFKGKGNSGVEQFMKMYYQTVRELSRLNEILLQHFQEAIIYAKRKEKIKPLNKRFQVRNDFIEVCNNNIFRNFPFSLLELFLLIQQNPSIKGVRASTIRLVRKSVHLIDENFRKDIRNRSLFMEIIRQPRHVGHELRRMHNYGVLNYYLPAFGAIEGQMQFDLFHAYTVDEHILFVVRNMRLFGLPENADKYPLCKDILEKLAKRELLYLAGLFHDIAKGRGGDHSKLGADDAFEFCKLHDLSEYDAKLVAWLVEKHLILSKTAQREDISDPEVINKFAAKVGDREHLNYLYLLTIADIQGTNPELWNSWKEALFTDLYKKTKQQAAALIKRYKQSKIEINKFWDLLGEDYFIRYSPDEIAWHTSFIVNIRNLKLPLIQLKEKTLRGGTEIFIYMQNQDYIFAITAKALDQLGLNIVDARIITSSDEYTLDSYTVLEENGNTINGKNRKDEIIQTLQHELSSLSTLPQDKWYRRERKLKQFPLPTNVTFTPDEKNNRTIMEVTAADRPGFLSRIGTAMAFCGARLQGAKIATYGARVEDVFFITDNKNNIITDKIKFECLRNSIVDTLSTRK